MRPTAHLLAVVAALVGGTGCDAYHPPDDDSRPPPGSDLWASSSLNDPCPGQRLGLDELRAGMAGTWGGRVTTPWDAPYDVTVTFDAGGGYSAHSTTVGAPPAFYWGHDADNPSKTWQLSGLAANGDGFGTLALYFGTSGTSAGRLEDVRWCAAGARLDFSLWNLSDGPLQVHLAH